LGIDYGERRIGFALSDPSQIIASTSGMIKNQGLPALLNKIEDFNTQFALVAIVLGMPLHMDGRIGEKGLVVKSLSHEINQKCHLPVFLWDERWTTVSVHKTLLQTGRSPAKSRDRIDQMAAAFILQSFLNRLNYIRKNVER
jgi:putative holliday junction resolvase